MYKKNFITKKRFGQHWLINEEILEKIKNVAELNEDDFILEIGPGRGALTKKLLDSKIKGLHAIELDKDLISYLDKKFQKNKNFSLQQGDILKTNIDSHSNKFTKVIANIPYNITGPIMEMFLGQLGEIKKVYFQKIIFLMQKEVAERIMAKNGSSNLGALSIRMKLMSNVKKICDVNPLSFDPPPKVYSSLIVFEPLKSSLRLDIELEKKIDKILKAAFNARRKKLKNTLRTILSDNDFDQLSNNCSINFDLRPQDLSIDEWIKIAKVVSKV